MNFTYDFLSFAIKNVAIIKVRISTLPKRIAPLDVVNIIPAI